MTTISNKVLQVSVSKAGAELQNIFNATTGLEYLWNGDAAFWPKKSPILFPVIGGLKDGSYTHEGATYHFNRHGFAREMDFEVEKQTPTSVTLVLKTSAATLAQYPFQFKFSITYTVTGNELKVTYLVENDDAAALYFSVGAHPAFNVPLVSTDTYTDYYLQFSSAENVGIYPILPDGLIATKAVPYLTDTDKLPLTKELFYKDALIFKELKSTAISILNTKNEHGLTLSYPDFPNMGIWSAKDANFVCIEPWCGLGDTEDTTGVLTEKEGIIKLDTKAQFERSWVLTTF